MADYMRRLAVEMAEDMTVLAIFTDVRGFTKWSEATEVFINLDHFVTGYLDILRHHFKAPEFHLKPLGDGAMILSQVPDTPSARELTKLLSKTLATIAHVEQDFKKHCANFSQRVGHSANLALGWGVVRGKVIKVGDDWAGHNLNKCSRLCNEARPFGIVIDRDDFPTLPRESGGLTTQIRRLRGIGDVAVWVTAEIATQFVPRERLRETPEVHVAGTVIDEARTGRLRLLLARRSPERTLFPGKLEGCGGQLRYSEGFAEGVRRHFRQELNLEIEALPEYHKFYEIREPNEPLIPGVRFLCRRVGTNEPSSTNHSELIWVTENQFRNLPANDFVGDLKHEVIELLERYKSQRSPQRTSKR